MFVKPNRIQKPRKRSYATSAEKFYFKNKLKYRKIFGSMEIRMLNDDDHNINNNYASLTAASFMFVMPNRMQKPWKRCCATTAKTD